MRKVLNISVPEDMLREIRKDIRAGGFASASEFVRAAIRAYQKEAAYRRVLRAERQAAKGKYIRIKSLRDLR